MRDIGNGYDYHPLEQVAQSVFVLLSGPEPGESPLCNPLTEYLRFGVLKELLAGELFDVQPERPLELLRLRFQERQQEWIVQCRAMLVGVDEVLP